MEIESNEVMRALLLLWVAPALFFVLSVETIGLPLEKTKRAKFDEIHKEP